MIEELRFVRLPTKAHIGAIDVYGVLRVCQHEAQFDSSR